MPQTYDLLRKKFMVETSDGAMDDGIEHASSILIDSGWKIGNNGVMYAPELIHVDKYTIGEQIDAQDFLVGEWDYTTSISGFAMEPEAR